MKTRAVYKVFRGKSLCKLISLQHIIEAMGYETTLSSAPCMLEVYQKESKEAQHEAGLHRGAAENQ